MSEFLRCQDCKHDKGKCVGSSRRGGHKNCFEPREMTNADRIRAMSDEELAECMRDSVTYKNAVRFGLVEPKPHKVVFYFERLRG